MHRTTLAAAALAALAVIGCGGKPSPFARIEISPQSPQVALGGTLQLSARGFDKNGVAMGTVVATWTTANASHATVDANGRVTGVAVGDAEISAANGDTTGKTTVTVVTALNGALTVSKGGDGTGAVTSSPAGIDCGATCTAHFAQGASVTLTAAPAADSNFTGWTGVCNGIDTTCTFTMGGSGGVTATFGKPRAQLRLTMTGMGMVTGTDSFLCTTASCALNYLPGEQVTLTAASNPAYPNWRFAGWTGACAGQGATCSLTMTSDRTAGVLFAVDRTLTASVVGGGGITSSPAGLDCNGNCTATYADGTQVTLTAAPGPGWYFYGWGGSCTGSSTTCTLTLAANLSVQATFTANVFYSMSAGVGGTGGGSVVSTPAGIDCPRSTCTASFGEGVQVTLKATPDTVSAFSGWGGGCAGYGDCVITMSSAQSVNATFDAAHAVSVSVAAGAGHITSNPVGLNCTYNCSAKFPQGSTIVLTAAPDAGYYFSGWGGDCSGLTCEFVVNAPKTITASFSPNPRVTVSTIGGGRVTSSPAGIDCGSACTTTNFQPNTLVTFTAAPDAGKQFVSWGGACSGIVTATCTVNILIDTQVSATFTGQPQITVSITGPGSVTSAPAGINCTAGSCSAPFAANSSVVLTAAASSGAVFMGWGGECSGTAGCTLFMANSNHAVTASFAYLRSITVNVVGSGYGSVVSSPAGIDCNDGTCTGSFPDGTLLTLTESSSPPSRFVSFSGACWKEPCSWTVWGNTSVTATFTMTYPLAISVAGTGRVTSTYPVAVDCSSSCSATYDDQQGVTLQAVAPAGWKFTGWAGDCSGTYGSCSVTMTQARSVAATFTQYRVLTVTDVGPGAIASTPPGLTCGARNTCSSSPTTFLQGDSILLKATPYNGEEFAGWTNGSCTGTGDCTVVMNGDQAVTATFTDYSVPAVTDLSLLPGESRPTPVTVALVEGSPVPVHLTLSGLPAGVTAAFSPATINAGDTSTLTFTAAASAPATPTPLPTLTITATGATGTTRTQTMRIEVRSPWKFVKPTSVRLEPGSSPATALVVETDRLVRIDTTSMKAIRTVASGLGVPRDVAVASTGAFAVVTHDNLVSRVDLATLQRTQLTNTLVTPWGVAMEAGNGTALATECGATSCVGTSRIVRINTTTGAVTGITLSVLPLGDPRGLAIEPGGATALVAEYASGVITRVPLDGTNRTKLASPGAGPIGVQSESAASALITDGRHVSRVDLALGLVTHLHEWPSGGIANPFGTLALEPGGATALLVDNDAGKVMRVNVQGHVRTAAASYGSATGLQNALGMAALDANTVLVTDCGPNDNCTGTGKIYRVNLTTGTVSTVASALNTAKGLALTSNRADAWVCMTGASKIQHFLVADGTPKEVIPADPDTFPVQPEAIALESDTSAIVTAGRNVYRVNLTTRTYTQLSTLPGSAHLNGVTIVGNAAYIADPDVPRVAKVDLTATPPVTATTVVAGGMENPFGIASEGNGTTVLVSDAAPASGEGGRLYRVDVGTGALTLVASGQGDCRHVVAGTAGGPVVAGLSRLWQATSAASDGPVPLSGKEYPTGVALDPARGSALMVDCGAPGADCRISGELVRVNLTTLAASLATAQVLNTPLALAVNSAGTKALVTDCGTPGTTLFDCSQNGRLLEVDLATGATQLLSASLNDPEGVAYAPAAGTALVVLRKAGCLETQVFGGGRAVVACNLTDPHGIALDPAGQAAIVGVTGALVRIDLATGAVSTIAELRYDSFAREPGKNSVLAFSGSSAAYGEMPLTGQLLRVDLATGAVTLLRSGLFEHKAATPTSPINFSTTMVGMPGLAVDATGANIFWSEYRTRSGALYKAAVP